MLKTLEDTLKWNTHKYQVGQVMFCPTCDHVLDARRAVSLDFYRDGKLALTSVKCRACWDKVRAQVALEVSRMTNVTLEVFNGKTKRTERFDAPQAERDNSGEQTTMDFTKEPR